MKDMEILRAVYRFVIDGLQSILLAFSVFIVVYIFLFRPFEVSGASMYPTFENGEHVLTNLITLRLDDPKQGDIVVFTAPKDDEKDFIKRIIAIPGDRISLQNNQIYVNGTLLDQSMFLASDAQTFGGSFLSEGKEVTVPNGYYFVMGDNRPYSSDSREWGFVKRDEIIGKSMFVYWPPGKLRWVENPYEK